MKKNSNIVLIIIFILTTQFAIAQKAKVEKAKLFDNKKYAVQFYEMKATGRGKALTTIVKMQGGKIGCELMSDKIKLEDIKFKIVIDSAYIEDEDEKRYIQLEATTTQEKDDYKWDVIINHYDIEGTVTQSKGGVERKKFEFSGSEKTK